jgi:hypothetical protein
MRRAAAAGFACALAAGGAHAQTAVCAVNLNVTDQDPAGLNVRAAPAGAIIGALKAKGEWVRVRVTGQSGAWARIDAALLITEDHAEGRSILHRAGYVAFSKLGIEYLIPHGALLASPAEGAQTLLKFAGDDEATTPRAEVLGCDGLFLKVRVGAVVGWTRDYCTNQFTTCA